MQAVVDEHANNTQATQRTGLVITLEGLLYVALIVTSLVLRIAELDTVPLTPVEAPAALAAFESLDVNAESVLSLPDSPTVYWAQRLGMMLFGGNEGALRLLTALAGVFLGVTPLFFRDVLGRTRAFLFSLLLTISPLLLIASRTSSGTVWALIFAALALWGFKRWWLHKKNGDALTATAAFGALILLAEPGGPVLALLLVGAFALALLFASVDTDNEEEVSEYFGAIRERLGGFPIASGLLVAAGVVAAVSTGFMLDPGGLNTVGSVVGGFFDGLSSGAGGASVLVNAFFYNPFLWLFVVWSLIWMVLRREIGFVDRFLIAWLALAVVATLLYRGGGSQHALWLTVPLAGLASYALAAFFFEDRMQSLWAEVLDDEDINRLYTVRWGKWMVALVFFGLLMVLSTHLQEIAREFLIVEGGSIAELGRRLSEVSLPDLRNSILWMLVGLMFTIVGFVLAAGVWGRTTTVQGYGLGLLGFVLLLNLSQGWNAAVFNSTNPVEPYYASAAHPESNWLRETLIELAVRETEGHLEIPLTLVLNPEVGITRDGLVAWQLRDFENVRFVNTVEAARLDEIVIMNEARVSEGENPILLPDLGGSYVGQPFIITQTWNPNTVQGFDFLSWWFQRRVRFEPQPEQVVTLWLRQDVFQGVPSDS